MGEDGKCNTEADWKNLFPDIHMQTNKYTGIKISNTEDVSDLTNVFLFIIDRSRGVLIPSDDDMTLSCSWKKLRMALFMMSELLQHLCKLWEWFSENGRRCNWNEVDILAVLYIKIPKVSGICLF